MKKPSVFLLFPHQLFQDILKLREADEVYLVEEFLFFNQYKFHKLKLTLHRASMKYYEDYLIRSNLQLHYVEATEKESDIRVLIETLSKRDISEIHFYDVCDDWLEQRIVRTCAEWGIKTKEYPSLLFINTKEDLKDYFGKREKYFQTDFYIQQRKKLNILIDDQQKPVGGKWSFDAENRLKYPKDKMPPKVVFPEVNRFYEDAINYVEKNFSDNYGVCSKSIVYPVTHSQSEAWLQQFLEDRFSGFGEYEDAIVGKVLFLHHSVLSPLINIGLLQPMQVVDAAIVFAQKNEVSLNSLEGFIRQIIGWRECIRGVYIYKGVQERRANFWKFQKPLPASFYDASTGIGPLDSTIKKVLTSAYCHHIERLMILGNFMVLTETNPDAVYQWFMELFIDAYDWVMVPNIYGMSQFADGGLMATKPYISGSNYLMKMSDFNKGDWQTTWDGLFWRFLHVHRDFFSKNPRLNMLLSTFAKMTSEKQQAHLKAADDFLQNT
jgi:deoxyribodipyrimidine photolyase-related protein